MTARPSIVALIAGSLVVAGCGAAPAVSPVQATWREETVLLPDRQTFVAAANRTGVVVGDMTTWVGIGGRGWLPAETVDESDRLGIMDRHGTLVSWADGGVVRLSRDGLSWSNALSGPGESNLATVVAFGNQLLLLGEGVRSSTGAWRSNDGSTWTAIEGAPLGMWTAATLPGRGLIAVGSSGPNAAVWKTGDARTWEPVVGPATPVGGTGALHGVAVNGSSVVAIGHVDGSATAWTSDDLATWTASPGVGGDDAYLANIAYVLGTFVITGRRGDLPVVWTSADGRTWSSVDLPIAAGIQGEAVETTVFDDRLVVFGYSNESAGTGGASHTGYLVWTLGPPR